MPCNCAQLANRHRHLRDAAEGAAMGDVGMPLNSCIDTANIIANNVAEEREEWKKVVDLRGFSVLSTANTNTSGNGSGSGSGSSNTSPTTATPQPYDPNFVLHSDCDDEMLLHFPFSEFTKIRGIAIIGAGSGYSPRSCRLFKDLTSDVQQGGFSAVSRIRPQQSLNLVETAMDDEVVYLLEANKFMSCASVSILIDGCFSQDETHILKIIFFGDSTKMPTERKMATNVVYELRGLPSDHPEVQAEQKLGNLVK